MFDNVKIYTPKLYAWKGVVYIVYAVRYITHAKHKPSSILFNDENVLRTTLNIAHYEL